MRELFEETDIKVSEDDTQYLTTVNSVFQTDGLHYVTVAVGCLIDDDVEPKVYAHPLVDTTVHCQTMLMIVR